MAGACGTSGEKLNAFRILVESPGLKRPGEDLGVDCKILYI